MKKRRAWIAILLIAVAGSAAGFGMAVRDEVAAMNDASAEIREQTAVLEDVRAEKAKFAEKLEEMAKSYREQADSAAASKGRDLLDMSFIAGKEQSILDQRQLRAEKRLAFQSERRDAAKKTLTKWSLGFAATELVLLAAVLVAARRAGSAASA